jgi:uncharacterized protein YdaU (DUF1376 family)
VNYFELHIGDYQRKTAHLTLAEHGAYSLMLQTFYATERPLPADRKVLYRLLRADTAAERKAIDTVVFQFWHKGAQGITNRRADQVLEAYRSWLSKQKANGSRGGRPPGTQTKPNGSHAGNPDETQGLTQTQPNGGDHARVPLPTSHFPPPTTQESRLQNFLSKITPTADLSSSVRADSEGSVCGTFKKVGG